MVKKIEIKVISGRPADIKMTPREKALMNLLISEINDCKRLEEVSIVTSSWVTANGLHPEDVKIYKET
jgi:hypothetical protein